MSPSLHDPALSSDTQSIFSRHVPGKSIEFLVKIDDANTRFWHLQFVDGVRPKPSFIRCLPGELLKTVARSNQVTDFSIADALEAVKDGNGDPVRKLRIGANPETYGFPDLNYDCDQQGAYVASSNSPPFRPPTALPSPQPTAREVPRPSTVQEATRNLSSGTLAARLQASDDLATLVETGNDEMAASVRTWSAKGDYNDDLGRLLGWLRPLRVQKDRPASPRKLLDTLSPQQANYLVALVANEDRQLRLSAKEVVGWLLQVSGNARGIDRLLTSLSENLRGPTQAVRDMEESYTQGTSVRRPFVFNLVDVQTGAWCSYSQRQRAQMVQTFEQAHDIGDSAQAKMGELARRDCNVQTQQ